MTQQPVRRLAAIFSADAVGYSRLMAEDEARTVETVERYRDEMSGLVRKYAGRVVDTPGDNLLAEFATATDATQAAVEIQKRLADLNAELAKQRKMDFRIGIHLGEVRVEGSRLYGDGINIAARIEGLAEPGGVWVSGAIYEQVQRNADFVFQDQGTRRVKNIPTPIRVYRALWQSNETPDLIASSPQDLGPVVAVLPFVNLSTDSDQEFFADGMTEEIINALGQIKEIRVIARTSVFSFKNSDADIAAIGARLKATTVVEGSIRKAGDRLRINVQLVDVAGGHQLWSEHYDKTLDDVFEIQDDIAATVVRKVRPQLLLGSAESLVSRQTKSQEAYELYLRASERLARLDRWDTRTAIEMLKDATSLDPDYANAWARLGYGCCQMCFSFESDEHWHQRATKAIDRAFELDPTNAEANCAHARLLWSPQAKFDHAPALRALNRAIERQPGMHFAHLIQGAVLIHVGLFEEAERALAQALVREPDNAFTLNVLAQARNFQGDLDAADEYYSKSRRVDPSFPYNVTG